MPSDTDTGSWNETHVGKTCSPASHTRSDRTPCDSELLQRAENDATFLPSIITGDESWVFGYDPETKQMLSQWKTPPSPRPKKARQSRSKVKTMLIAFFDGGSDASWVSSPTPDHESDYLHNRSATPSRCSSSKTASQMVFRYLASAPRQCAMPRGPERQGILGQAQHPRGSPPALLTRFGLLLLLPLPQAEEHPEGVTISRRGGDKTKYNTAVAGHSQTSLSNMHWKVEGSLESLHTVWWVVLWRR
jgi:hypothetical protein